MPAITFLRNFAARMLLLPFVPHPTSGVISFPVAKFHANTPRDFNDRATATENLNIFPSIPYSFSPDFKRPTFCHVPKSPSPPLCSKTSRIDSNSLTNGSSCAIEIIECTVKPNFISSCAAILRRKGGRKRGKRTKEEKWKGERGGKKKCNIAKSVRFVVKPKRGNESRGPLLWFGRKGRGESSVFIDTNFRGRGDFFLQLLSPRSGSIRVFLFAAEPYTPTGEKRITKGILCLRSCHPRRPRAHRDFSTKSFETFSLFHKRCKHALSDQYLSVIYNYNFKRFDCAE